MVNTASEVGNHIGLVSELQFTKVQDLIQKGIDEGARLVTGGLGRPGPEPRLLRPSGHVRRLSQRHAGHAR